MAPEPNKKSSNKSDSMEQTHLMCAGCGQKIAGTYFNVDGKIYCFDCNEKMGAKPAKSAGPSWAMGTVIAVVILGLAALVFYLVAGETKTIAPVPVADPAPLATPTMQDPDPAPAANSVPAQPAASNAQVQSSVPAVPTPTELPPSALMNVVETPAAPEPTIPVATDTPSLSAIPLSTPAP